jgi:hypothetical protein
MMDEYESNWRSKMDSIQHEAFIGGQAMEDSSLEKSWSVHNAGPGSSTKNCKYSGAWDVTWFDMGSGKMETFSRMGHRTSCTTDTIDRMEIFNSLFLSSNHTFSGGL